MTTNVMMMNAQAQALASVFLVLAASAVAAPATVAAYCALLVVLAHAAASSALPCDVVLRAAHHLLGAINKDTNKTAKRALDQRNLLLLFPAKLAAQLAPAAAMFASSLGQVRGEERGW
jgi:hypothetical protein